MTDTGTLPEGRPGSGHGPETPLAADAQPAPPGDFGFPAGAEGVETLVEEDDLLFLPGAQGAWSEAAPGAVRRPPHMGPVPGQGIGMVRSLADRGPAAAAPQQAPVQPLRPAAPAATAAPAGPADVPVPVPSVEDRASQPSRTEPAPVAPAVVPVQPVQTPAPVRPQPPAAAQPVEAPAPEALAPEVLAPEAPVPPVTAPTQAPAAAEAAPAPAPAPAAVQPDAPVRPADGSPRPPAAADPRPEPGPATIGPEYLDTSGPAAELPVPQLGRIPAQPEPWPSAPEAPEAPEAEQAPQPAAAVPALAIPDGAYVHSSTAVTVVLEEPPAPPADEPLDEAPEAPEPAAAAEAAPPKPATAPAAPFDDSDREAVHRVMRERRDIRNGFRPDPVPHEVLLRVLEAAHTAPSVGHSQPWDFVVIRSEETRGRMHELAMRQRDAYARSLPKARAKQFKEMKIEAILDTPVNIVVTADPTRGGRHTLGRHTQPQMAPYSSALAVENLWLAARAEGLGVGWVSFFDERELCRELELPEHLDVVAYLCVGYVDEFPEEPELVQAGWSKRRPLSWVVHEETYGRRALPGEQPHDLLLETLDAIRPLDAKALGEAWERQKRMTKPAGSLGMLEIISAQLCGLSRTCPPPIPEPAAVAIFAGDHGVHAQGVTPWPQEVTAQMVANFLSGGAVCNAFAAQVGAEVCVVDVGVAAELPATPGLVPRKVRPGTADMSTGPAMSREEAVRAVEMGIETARDLVAAGNKALLTGEMGIANTTASAALISVFTQTDPAEVTGRGTGINDETHARKVEVVRGALELHQPDPADPVGVLASVGGLEHAALVGFILGGASLRTPVVLDGVSAGAAALVARAIAPEALAACVAGHRSAEPGHSAALTKLGLRPLIDLDLRLGEGTGALLALPLVQSAARAMHEVATFDAAGVTEKG
ncbi:nicotinate-nucleotide--dimethylbenzimidazole phosphoribosyltransferase [Streptomyces polyrhachis]|uniref:Nicotinate-nucleotide--dimethylbenzimidazole phosphoribosyltransferase n=1 Tax=Streptomyces polyrhachis TaxID=1282885 RepID=A0ABW2GB69_9ACTN